MADNVIWFIMPWHWLLLANVAELIIFCVSEVVEQSPFKQTIILELNPIYSFILLQESDVTEYKH